MAVISTNSAIGNGDPRTVQVELNEERREGEAQLASRVEQLEKQRREWKKTTKALENQEQAPNGGTGWGPPVISGFINKEREICGHWKYNIPSGELT